MKNEILSREIFVPKLRNVTIWPSCVVLLGITGFLAYTASSDGIARMVFGTPLFLLFCGFPPIVSIVLSTKLKNPFSHILLVITSFLYGVWFAYLMYDAFYLNRDALSGVVLFCVGIFALPVLLPLWILAIIVEVLFKKSTSGPGAAFCSVPDTLKRENEVKWRNDDP